MVSKTKAVPRPAARPKPKSAGVKPRAPARTPARRPVPKSQVKTTGNIDYYRPFVTVTQGLLKRLSPFLTFLLTPTAVADGTITAKDQKRLETYFRDIPSRGQAEAKTGAKQSRSESAVSGAALVGRWFKAVADDRSSYRLQKAGLSGLLGGVDATLDAALARDSSLPTSASRPRLEALAGRKLVRAYEKDPAAALNDLVSPNKARRALARNWLARHPVSKPSVKPKPKPAVKPAPRPAERPATRPVEVPRSPRPGKPSLPSKVPPKVPVTPPAVAPEVFPVTEPLYWREVVLEGRVVRNNPELRLRERLARDFAPRRERDRKEHRQSKQYALYQFITGAWGKFTEVTDVVDCIVGNLSWSDTGKDYWEGKGTESKVRALKRWINGELQLDLIGFAEDMLVNSVGDEVIGRLSGHVTKQLVNFNAGTEDLLTTQQRRNSLVRATRQLGLPSF